MIMYKEGLFKEALEKPGFIPIEILCGIIFYSIVAVVCGLTIFRNTDLVSPKDIITHAVVATIAIVLLVILNHYYLVI